MIKCWMISWYDPKTTFSWKIFIEIIIIIIITTKWSIACKCEEKTEWKARNQRPNCFNKFIASIQKAVDNFGWVAFHSWIEILNLSDRYRILFILSSREWGFLFYLVSVFRIIHTYTIKYIISLEFIYYFHIFIFRLFVVYLFQSAFILYFWYWELWIQNEETVRYLFRSRFEMWFDQSNSLLINSLVIIYQIMFVKLCLC